MRAEGAQARRASEGRRRFTCKGVQVRAGGSQAGRTIDSRGRKVLLSSGELPVSLYDTAPCMTAASRLARLPQPATLVTPKAYCLPSGAQPFTFHLLPPSPPCNPLHLRRGSSAATWCRKWDQRCAAMARVRCGLASCPSCSKRSPTTCPSWPHTASYGTCTLRRRGPAAGEIHLPTWGMARVQGGSPGLESPRAQPEVAPVCGRLFVEEFGWTLW